MQKQDTFQQSCVYITSVLTSIPSSIPFVMSSSMCLFSSHWKQKGQRGHATTWKELKKNKSMVENSKLNKYQYFYLQLCFTFPWASPDWIVVCHFSALGVFPCGAAVATGTSLLTTHSGFMSSCLDNARHKRPQNSHLHSYCGFIGCDLKADGSPLVAAQDAVAIVVEGRVRQAVVEGQLELSGGVKVGLGEVELRRQRLFFWPAGWTLAVAALLLWNVTLGDPAWKSWKAKKNPKQTKKKNSRQIKLDDFTHKCWGFC